MSAASYDMRIDPRESSRVQVLVDIDSTAPVSDKTVAELSLQGVTGLLYMDLIQDTGTRRLTAAGAEREVSGDPLGALELRRAARLACRIWSASPATSRIAPRAC